MTTTMAMMMYPVYNIGETPSPVILTYSSPLDTNRNQNTTPASPKSNATILKILCKPIFAMLLDYFLFLKATNISINVIDASSMLFTMLSILATI